MVVEWHGGGGGVAWRWWWSGMEVVWYDSDITDLEVGELYRELGVLRHSRDDELHLPGVGAEPITDVNADPLDHDVYETFNLGVEVSPTNEVVETKDKRLTR